MFVDSERSQLSNLMYKTLNLKLGFNLCPLII